MANAEEIPPNKENHISIKATDHTKIEVVCDGEILYTGELPPAKTIRCDYDEESSVLVKDLSKVSIANNDRRISPMGPLSAKRRLIFRD